MRFLMRVLAGLWFASLPALASDAPQTFLIVLHPAPGKLGHFTEADEKAIDAHFARLKQAERDGILILAGPTNPPELGLAIITAANLAAAEAFADADPAIRAGVFTREPVRAFALALSRTAPFGGDFAMPQGSRILRKEIEIEAPLDDVWHAWTTSEGMRAVLETSTNIQLRLGGPFEIFFLPDAPPGLRGSDGMRVLSFLPEKMLSFEWNAPPSFGKLRDKRTWVVVTFTPEGPNRLKVSLDHNGWGEGEDWDRLYAYFDKAWGSVLSAFATHFKKP